MNSIEVVRPMSYGMECNTMVVVPMQVLLVALLVQLATHPPTIPFHSILVFIHHASRLVVLFPFCADIYDKY